MEQSFAEKTTHAQGKIENPHFLVLRCFQWVFLPQRR
jgi:hypothetical protein